MPFDTNSMLGGLVVLAAGQLLAGLWFVVRLDKRLALLELTVSSMEKHVDAQSDVMRNVGERFAEQSGRIDAHDSTLVIVQRDIADLRRGRGFIRDASRPALDGLYCD